MFAIRITNATAPLIASMNNQVAPAIEHDQTFFVYESENVVPDIITYNQLKTLISKEEWTRKNYAIWQNNGRFAILMDKVTEPLIRAMNHGVLPSFDKSISTYFIDECVPYIMSSEDFYKLRTQETWTPLTFIVWQK